MSANKQNSPWKRLFNLNNAAPELLEACKEALEAIRIEKMQCEPTTVALSNAEAKLREAIAKAEGN